MIKIRGPRKIDKNIIAMIEVMKDMLRTDYGGYEKMVSQMKRCMGRCCEVNET